MRLASFITDNLDAILVDWVAFAREQLPAAANMDEAALLDHGRLILEEIATDMRRPQGDDERQAKSEGNSSSASTRRMCRRAAMPGSGSGRDSRSNRWLPSTGRCARRSFVCGPPPRAVCRVEDFEDVTRFNEAVDQPLRSHCRSS